MNTKLSPIDYQVVSDLKQELIVKYGSLIQRICCYGSRIYSGKQDTDFDILVITERKLDWTEVRQVYRDIFRFGLIKDIQFDVKFFSSEEVDFTYKQMPFLKDVLSYGVSI